MASNIAYNKTNGNTFTHFRRSMNVVGFLVSSATGIERHLDNESQAHDLASLLNSRREKGRPLLNITGASIGFGVRLSHCQQELEGARVGQDQPCLYHSTNDRLPREFLLLVSFSSYDAARNRSRKNYGDDTTGTSQSNRYSRFSRYPSRYRTRQEQHESCSRVDALFFLCR